MLLGGSTEIFQEDAVPSDDERLHMAEDAGGSEAWADAWDAMGSEFAFVMTNNAPVWTESRFIPVRRDGQLVGTWWTYSLAPIGEAEGAGGVLMAFNEIFELPKISPA